MSFGDLNKTRSSYPIRHEDYQKTLAEFDLVELLDTNTHIPKRRGATVATTDPDSVMSSCCHSESVEMVSRETLRSDHLAYIIRSDFNWPSREPEPPKFGHFFEYSKLEPEKVEKHWDACGKDGEHDQIWDCFHDILMDIRKFGNISPMPPNLPPEYADKSTDEIWKEKIVSPGKMCDLGAVFKLEKKIQNVKTR